MTLNQPSFIDKQLLPFKNFMVFLQTMVFLHLSKHFPPPHQPISSLPLLLHLLIKSNPFNNRLLNSVFNFTQLQPHLPPLRLSILTDLHPLEVVGPTTIVVEANPTPHLVVLELNFIRLTLKTLCMAHVTDVASATSPYNTLTMTPPLSAIAHKHLLTLSKTVPKLPPG